MSITTEPEDYREILKMAKGYLQVESEYHHIDQVEGLQMMKVLNLMYVPVF
jgi:hypothetical protein